MPAHILSIGTALPRTAVSQPAVRDLFGAQPGVDRLTRRLIRMAFDQSAIDQRYTVLPELVEGGSCFIDEKTRALLSPSTGTRNDVYAREAPGLFAAAARSALTRAGVEAAAVTHVVTASCTGFFAPGPEYRLVRDLRLRPDVERDHLGFLGCAAALPALRSADRICARHPEAVVLLVCAEICTIHVRASNDPEQIVASAVFGDGAAAAVVTAAPRADGGPSLLLDTFSTSLTNDGHADLRWVIGDHGFEMTLTAEVPRIIGREITAALSPLLDAADGPIPSWAVHPGGRSILDRVQGAFELPDTALAASRGVLREIGNVSSATVLFILERLLAEPELRDGDRALGVAFGPGLTVESALMTVRMSG